MAVPNTSARSVAMIAPSANTQRTSATGRGNMIRLACARSIPPAIPSRTASACNRIAMMFDIRMTDSSV